MSESVSDIVARIKLEGIERYDRRRLSDDIRSLIASWDARGKALKDSRPWVESGPDGSWKDAVLARIDAALSSAGCSQEKNNAVNG